MQTILITLALFLAIGILIFRTRKPKPQSPVYFLKDEVNVFDSYGCRVIGKVSGFRDSKIRVDYIDSHGDYYSKLFPVEHVMKPNYTVKTP